MFVSTWSFPCAVTLIRVSEDWSTDTGTLKAGTSARVRRMRTAERVADGTSNFCEVSLDGERTWTKCRTPTT
jgi:hypothetical protein